MEYKYLIEWKTLSEKEKLLVTNNFFFPHNVFKSCLLLMCYNEYLWSKGSNGIPHKILTCRTDYFNPLHTEKGHFTKMSKH